MDMTFVIYSRQLLTTSAMNFIVIILPPIYVYLDVRVEGSWEVQGSTVCTWPLSLWHQLQVQGSTRAPLGSIVCLKVSQNSLKSVILIVMVYYRERLQIKIGQWKKNIGQNLCSFLRESGHVTFLALIRDSTHGVLPAGELTQTSVLGIFIEAPLCKHDSLPMLLISVSSPFCQTDNV